MYFEFDDQRRFHQPYVDSYYRGKSHAHLTAVFSADLEDANVQLTLHELEERVLLHEHGHHSGKLINISLNGVTYSALQSFTCPRRLK